MESVRRIAILGPNVEISTSPAAAATAAGVGIVAGGGVFYLLSRAGASLGLAALGGAVLGGIGAFAVVARSRDWDVPSEDGGLVDTAPGKSEGSMLATYLSEHLTQDLTAYIAGVDDEEIVGRWISEETEPEPLPLGRLRTAYEATRYIVDRFDGETAQSWFSGMNPWLDDEAPGYVLRHSDDPETWESVIDAASDFSEY